MNLLTPDMLAQATTSEGSTLLGVAAILTAVFTFLGGIYAVRRNGNRATRAEEKAENTASRVDRTESAVHATVVRSANAEGKADALTSVVNTLMPIITSQAEQISACTVRIDKCESERDHLREEVGDLRRMVHAGIWSTVAPKEET